MKTKRNFFVLVLLISFSIISCNKQEYFKSESGIKKQLQGTWDLIPIPRYITITTDSGSYQKERLENWVFGESIVTITNNNGGGETGTSEFSVHTTWTKVEVELKGVTAPLTAALYNGKWQVVRLDDNILSIANDHDGSTGLTQLEFKKR